MTEQTDREQKIIADIKETLNREIAKFEDAKAEFAKSVADNPADAIEWNATNILETQTRMELAKETLTWIEYATSDDPGVAAMVYRNATTPETEIEQVLAGLKRAKEEFTYEVMRGRFYPTSTCPAHNLVTMVKGREMARFAGGYSGELDTLIAYANAFINHLNKQAA